jgi:rubredoxin
MWIKLCKDCKKPRWHELMYSRCKECQYAFEASKPKKVYELKKTKPKLIWVKRKARIRKQGSEMKVFVEMWLEQPHTCENCWKHIELFHPSVFAHKLNKRDNPELRYDKNNIALVHWIFETMDKTWKTYNCHKEFDLKFNKEKYG